MGEACLPAQSTLPTFPEPGPAGGRSQIAQPGGLRAGAGAFPCAWLSRTPAGSPGYPVQPRLLLLQEAPLISKLGFSCGRAGPRPGWRAGPGSPSSSGRRAPREVW